MTAKMSCRYEMYAGFSKAPSRVFSSRTYSEQAKNEFSSVSFNDLNACNQYKNVLAYGGTADCRESMVSALQTAVEAFPEVLEGKTRVEQLYIRFSANTLGNEFEKPMIEKLQIISDKVLNYGPYTNFDLYFEDGYGILSINALDRHDLIHADIAAASLFLYFVRKSEIIDWIVNRVKGSGLSFRNLLREMVDMFLNNKDWGDSANENVSLALFCYSYGSGLSPRDKFCRTSGPEHYADVNISMEVVDTFVSKYLIPWMRSNKKKFTTSPTNSELPFSDFLPVHRTFRREFILTLRSLLAYHCLDNEELYEK